MRMVKILNTRKLIGFFAVSALCFAGALPASAQYMRDITKNKTSNENAADAGNGVIYNPYVGQSAQREIYESQTAPQVEDIPVPQMELGNALMRDFLEKSRNRQINPTQLDANAPSRNELPPVTSLPDDPIKYCEKYEQDNPQQEDVQAYMESFLHERIKPISQMRIIVPRTCLNKVREIAENMLIDYTAYKRNELLMRAGNDQTKLAQAARKANELPQANLTYSTYANSECKMSRRDVAKNTIELLKMTEACEIQMLKRRIQQIAAL